MIKNKKHLSLILLIFVLLMVINGSIGNAYQEPIMKPTFSKQAYQPSKDPSGRGSIWTGYIRTDNHNGWGYQTPYNEDTIYDNVEGQRVIFNTKTPFGNDGTNENYMFARFMYIKATDVVSGNYWKTLHPLGNVAPKTGNIIGDGMILIGRPHSRHWNKGRTMFNSEKAEEWATALNGNVEYVLSSSKLTKHTVQADDIRSPYLQFDGTSQNFIYVRDLAALSGAYVEVMDGSLTEVNGDGWQDYSIAEVHITEFPFIVKAGINQSGQYKGGLDRSGANSPPSNHSANVKVEKGKPVSLELDLSEYAYGTEVMRWSYSVDGPQTSRDSKQVVGSTSNGRPYGMKYIDSIPLDSNITNTVGDYVITVNLRDGVERPASTVTINLSVVDEEVPPVEPPPPSSGGEGSGCQRPEEVPERYEHELDVEVTRLDARTVDKNTSTETDVYVKRADFSSSRDQAKNEFEEYIEKTEKMKEDCETKKEQFESEKEKAESEKRSAESEKRSAESAKSSAQSRLSSAESGLSSCLSTPPDKDGNTPNCSSYRERISSASSDISRAESRIRQAESKIKEAETKIKEFEAKIKEAEKFIADYEEVIQKANDELQYINQNESQYNVINPSVQLRYGNRTVGTINVSLSEGEGPKKYVFPKWVLSDDGTIMAQINENGPYNEFRYSSLPTRMEMSLGYNNRVGNVLYSNTQSNNWKSTPIYIASYDTNSCPAPSEVFKPSTIEGVVRTVNDNGNVREIKERLTTSFSLVPRTSMRAGFGFEYRIQTSYQNFDTEPNPSNATGTKQVSGYFPTLVNYLPYTTGNSKVSFDQWGNPNYADEGYEVFHETNNLSVPRNENKVWNLPPVAIEEYSGNVFSIRNGDYQNHIERNQHENLLTTDNEGNPLTKWYVDFTQPDGDYNFVVRTYDAGVNHLNTCMNGTVLIDGSITGDPNGNDDYVKRSVTTKNPFPSGIGWNWNGYSDLLTNLDNWYSEWYRNPDEVPQSSYAGTYLLSMEKLEEIRAFNESVSHEYKLGRSLFDHVNIPNSR